MWKLEDILMAYLTAWLLLIGAPTIFVGGLYLTYRHDTKMDRFFDEEAKQGRFYTIER